MTWILGRCPSLRQAEVLISWAFFFLLFCATEYTDLLSKCPCNHSSRFKFSPLLCCKRYAIKIKALLTRRSCSSVPVCSFAPSLDGVFLFLLFQKCSMLMIWLTHFWGDLSSYIGLWEGKVNSLKQNKLFSGFIWILAQFAKVHEVHLFFCVHATDVKIVFYNKLLRVSDCLKLTFSSSSKVILSVVYLESPWLVLGEAESCLGMERVQAWMAEIQLVLCCLCVTGRALTVVCSCFEVSCCLGEEHKKCPNLLLVVASPNKTVHV